MTRRHFFSTGAVVAPLAMAQELPDAKTNPARVEYFFLGNGRLIAAVQSSPQEEAGAHTGLLLWSPQHFVRKATTLLYNQRTGLRLTRAVLTVGDQTYTAQPGATIEWDDVAYPAIRIRWKGGDSTVEEHLYIDPSAAVLVREIRVTPPVGTVTLTLSPNQFYFDEYDVDRTRGILRARGWARLELHCASQPRVHDRDLEIPVSGDGPARFIYSLNEEAPVTLGNPRTAWDKAGKLDASDPRLEFLFRRAQSGLRAVVALNGKMDGGPLQYNFEWVRDAVMTGTGALLCGLPSVAESILRRAVERNLDDEGRTAETARLRPDDIIELDQNGQLLWALRSHWVWTGNDTLIRGAWPRIRAAADFVLRPVFRDPAVGLVRNSREFWERTPAYGVLEGYELAYQAWNIVGLRHAAEMATHVGDSDSARRWRHAAELMLSSMLSHPRFALVDGGRFIKRRLTNGDVQRTMRPPDPSFIPETMPLRTESTASCDPDTTMALPVALGLVDPRGELARNTLAALEELWNQRWTGGGYGRYHVNSEPDSPGPWPFASLFVARAYAEAGDDRRVWRVLEWLLSVPGAASGAWFEFYGDRPSPPLPSVGIIPWTWAEIVFLLVHHVAGVRPAPNHLLIRPHLLAGVSQMHLRLPVNGVNLDLTLERTVGESFAEVNGRRVPLPPEGVRLPRPKEDVTVHIVA